MDANYDYNSAFKSISLKLKKRILRKPNVSDAIEEYTALSRRLENEECFGLSAHCMQQVAKSYHSIGNTILESFALQSAAKQYLNAEITSSVETGVVSFNEDLLSAISAYDTAIKVHTDQNERHLAAMLCLQLADILSRKFERHFEAIPYYERTINLFTSANDGIAPIQAVFVQLKLSALKVFTCDYQGALTSYTDIYNSILAKFSSQINRNKTGNEGSSLTPNGIYSQLLVEVDISKLLLLLYLKPTKLKPEHSNTIEVYTWFQTLSNNTNSYLPVNFMDRDLFIILQSFVMACESNDAKVLYTLETEIMPHLNHVQNYLLSLITDQLLHSSYTDDLLFE